MDITCPECGDEFVDSNGLIDGIDGECPECGYGYEMECFMTPEGVPYMYAVWR